MDILTYILSVYYRHNCQYIISTLGTLIVKHRTHPLPPPLQIQVPRAPAREGLSPGVPAEQARHPEGRCWWGNSEVRGLAGCICHSDVWPAQQRTAVHRQDTAGKQDCHIDPMWYRVMDEQTSGQLYPHILQTIGPAGSYVFCVTSLGFSREFWCSL